MCREGRGEQDGLAEAPAVLGKAARGAHGCGHAGPTAPRGLTAPGPLPLLVQPPVLLAVGAVDLQQGLQVAVVRLHVLVIHVDIIQFPLLLENLLCGACRARGSELGARGLSLQGTSPTPAGK